MWLKLFFKDWFNWHVKYIFSLQLQLSITKNKTEKKWSRQWMFFERQHDIIFLYIYSLNYMEKINYLMYIHNDNIQLIRCLFMHLSFPLFIYCSLIFINNTMECYTFSSLLEQEMIPWSFPCQKWIGNKTQGEERWKRALWVQISLPCYLLQPFYLWMIYYIQFSPAQENSSRKIHVSWLQIQW